MTRAIRIHEHGGPEVMRLEDVDVGEPGPGEARVRHAAVGLNFIDTYHRTGLYPVSLPSGLGMEAAGVIEAVGEGVTELSPGQRVAYAAGPPGAYAEARVVAADRLVPLPNAVDDEAAAAAMLKGMTVEYLIRRTHRVSAGETVLLHAAAGGVGLVACQWLKHLGATVIGTVGSDEKAELARAHGCDHPIVYTREDFAARVRELVPGGVPVVYDSVGAATFEASLDCLAPRGLMVSFGNASGKPPALEVGALAQKGSLFLTRPTLMTYVAARADLLESAAAVFDVIARGAVTIAIGQRFPLADAAEAHRALEDRATTGSTVLIP
ncbi:MAG: quinone oxidoreductase [Myxococcota bacterium]|nr:quinone oxidoreductase [Myxococcota bacterium]